MSKSTPISKTENTNICETKKKLFTIATMAYQMWEYMDEHERVDTQIRESVTECDGMITKIAKTYLVSNDLK
jgi:hypothetical protein